MEPPTPQDGPKRLGDFEIIRELGRGGMGVVYEARQRSLNRHVALKVLSTGLGLTTKAIMRFKREAEAAAKLHHTNIVPIYFTGDEGRIPYYAMELVNGPSLDQVIQQLRAESDVPSNGSLESTDDVAVEEPSVVPDWVNATCGFEKPSSSVEDSKTTSTSTDSSSFGSGSTYFDNVAGMIAGVADALAHAHDQGVIHRDIKPSNLLLSQDGRLSVNDFGLARMLEQPGMTISGELMGSPMYMSPEQITSGRIPLDHRTDIYSLGASLYQMLTLQTPFDGQQRDLVLSQIIHKEPARLRSVNKKIPKDLETICLKAMEKDPDRRYQTADLMAEDLRRFVDRNAISARRVGTVERVSRWARKNRALASMACLTIVASLSAAIFVYGAWQKNRTILREQAEEKALELAMQGDLKEALSSIETAKLYGASAEWVSILTGQVALSNGDAASAVALLEAAVSQDSQNVMARSILIRAYLANGQWHRYLQQIDHVLSMKPVSPRDKLFQGAAVYLHSTEKSLELMTAALEQRKDFHLGRVMRAYVLIFHALDLGNQDLLDRAKEDLAVAGAFLNSNPFLSQTQLYARLASYKFAKRAKNAELEERLFTEANVELENLEKHPGDLRGNYLRLHFHAFRSDLPEMERTIEDVMKRSGNSSFVTEPYLSYCFANGRSEDALKLLDRMSNQDNLFALVYRAIFHLETTENRQRAEEVCANLIENYPESSWPYNCLTLLGKSNDSSLAARQYANEVKFADHRSFAYDEIRFHGRLIDEKDFLKRATNSELSLGRAYFAIGVRCLAEGDRMRAIDMFERSADTLVFHWSLVVWAKAFAERLKSDEDWPDGLPAKHANAEIR